MLAEPSFTPSDLSVWDPATAASAGASFAAVLGALVLAVTFQIAGSLGQSRGRNVGALLVAPISLLLLLAAAYMYVVLSGTVPASQNALTSCVGYFTKQSTATEAGVGNGLPHQLLGTQTCDLVTIRIAAEMFALAGSYLGLGAISLAFTLVLVANANAKIRSSITGTFTMLLATTLISGAALIWGYRDAFSAFFGKLTIGSFMHETYAYGWIGLGILTGGAITWLAQKSVLSTSGARDANKFGQGVLFILVIVYLVLPFSWFLIAQDTPRGLNSRGVNFDQPPASRQVTKFCLWWVSLAVGVFYYLLWTGFRADRSPHPDVRGRAKSRRRSAA